MVVLGMGCLALVGFLVVVRGVFVAGSHVVEAEVAYETSLSVATWNVAAINNNPFEYWITHHDPAYNSLMEDVQRFVDEPGDRDVPVSDVFTESMFGELKASMEAAGWAGLDVVERARRGVPRPRRFSSDVDRDVGRYGATTSGTGRSSRASSRTARSARSASRPCPTA